MGNCFSGNRQRRRSSTGTTRWNEKRSSTYTGNSSYYFEEEDEDTGERTPHLNLDNRRDGGPRTITERVSDWLRRNIRRNPQSAPHIVELQNRETADGTQNHSLGGHRSSATVPRISKSNAHSNNDTNETAFSSDSNKKIELNKEHGIVLGTLMKLGEYRPQVEGRESNLIVVSWVDFVMAYKRVHAELGLELLSFEQLDDVLTDLNLAELIVYDSEVEQEPKISFTLNQSTYKTIINDEDLKRKISQIDFTKAN